MTPALLAICARPNRYRSAELPLDLTPSEAWGVLRGACTGLVGCWTLYVVWACVLGGAS